MIQEYSQSVRILRILGNPQGGDFCKLLMKAILELLRSRLNPISSLKKPLNASVQLGAV